MNFNEEEIENYLLGKLNGEDLVDFEIRMSLNPELKKEVEPNRFSFQKSSNLHARTYIIGQKRRL